jgi:hypothetical protein
MSSSGAGSDTVEEFEIAAVSNPNSSGSAEEEE